MKRCWLLLSLVPVFAYGVTTTLEYEDSREAASRTAISNEIASAVGSVDVGVTSVNSKTGAVVLAAADVGAIPSTGGKHQTSPGCTTDYLASGAIGGPRVIASSASPEYDYTSYARMGIAVRRLGGATKDYLYDDSEKGIARLGDVASAVPGNYSVVSNRAMIAITNHQSLAGYATTGDVATAISGIHSFDPNTNRVVIGSGLETNPTGDLVCIGGSSKSTGIMSTALGFGAYALGDYSLVLGGSDANGYGNTSIGVNNQTFNQYSLAAGVQNEVHGYLSSAFGHANKIYGNYGTVLGVSNQATNTNHGILIGLNNYSVGDAAVVGNANKVGPYAEHSVAIGDTTCVSNFADVAIGYFAAATGSSATSIGHSSSAGGGNSVAIGHYVKSTATGAAAIGNYAIATNDHSVVLGSSDSTLTSPRSHGSHTVNLGGSNTDASKVFIGDRALDSIIQDQVPTTADDVGAYPAEDGATLAGNVSTLTGNLSTLGSQVASIGAYLNAEDARFVSTNYDSVVNMPEAYVEIKTYDGASGSNSWITIWQEMRRWTAFVGNAFDWQTWNGFYSWATNITHEISCKADRCWGLYDSETGGYSPEGYTQISSSNILIAAGMAYQRTITSDGAVWVLQCNQGVAHVGGDTNGFFRVIDGDGNVQFEIIKGDKREMGADASGITVNNSTTPPTVTIPYSVEAGEHPTLQICDNLATANWKSETDSDCIATVSWSGVSGAYVATVRRKTSGGALFVKATFMAGGETYIRNVAPVGMDSIMLNGTRYYLGTATISGHTVLTLSTTAP